MNPTNTNSFKARNISWTTIILAIITFITFIAVSNPRYGYYDVMPMRGGSTESSGRVSVPPSTGAPVAQDGVGNYLQDKNASMPYPYPYGNPEVSSDDTREFLKVYYNANMRTRDVQGLTRRVETTVRGYSGRIDQISISDKSGYVNFVVPQSKYDAFRSELEGFVGSRFLIINISSQNLLSQKVSIEEQQKQADLSLSNFKTARQTLINTHTNTVRSLQTKIDTGVQLLLGLNAQTQTPEVSAQVKKTTDEVAYFRKQLLNENASYKNELSNADNNIKYAEDWQKAVQTQDKVLLENVATVSGTVSVQWISLWDIIQIYLPGYSIPLVFALFTLISFFWDKRRFKMMQTV